MKRIVLPLDGSECSEAAIPLAKELAGLTGASIVATVVGTLPETTNQAQGERRDLLDELNQLLKKFDLEAEKRVVMAGDPARGILEVADEENADMIIMSTHGRSGMSELAQGSVAHAVVRDGRKPVLLVRPHSDDK